MNKFFTALQKDEKDIALLVIAMGLYLCYQMVFVMSISFDVYTACSLVSAYVLFKLDDEVIAPFLIRFTITQAIKKESK